ncbi:DUF393 domain-containing protein [Gramella lutea]|uniref:DUF393 domain-containing protein n=1 Tax=Christiangramia lutea TaxID=1607951 RepID=A0A9X1V7C2_9FLAO|nr:DCC1-like thiol-disulfide oxidoreductase family protein [Christiangramia lutea]MCH4823778.1 DUF393 domain-containing protein [Christiangramia lutea]
MFEKIANTKNPPADHIFVWDGQCGFCEFWKTRWENKTSGKLVFKTYQDCASSFQDIPLKEFKKASRLIEKDGHIYSGPDSAYRILWHAGNKNWHELYKTSKFFQYLSDHLYNHIAKNRGFYFKITKLLFGKDPLNLKLYWLLYLGLIALLIILLI